MSKGQAERGSQRDIQWLFNEPKNRILLESRLGIKIANDGWLSPVHDEEYREYQDKGFMRKIGLSTYSNELVGKFWPKRGPVWDGLAKSSDGTILLFEAKAHISELFGGGMKAKSKDSCALIRKSLSETAKYIGACYDAVSWTDTMYQTANRLAHLYFLNKILKEKIGVKAKLVYLVFLNDESVLSCKETEEMWNTAIDVAERCILKLPFDKTRFNDGSEGSWRDWVSHVFIDFKDIKCPDFTSI